MAELFLSAVLPVLFEKLTSPELRKFAAQEGVRSKLKKWEKRLKMIKALLNDAEQKQLGVEAVRIWLEDLEELAYDAEDILDEYATGALRRRLRIEEHQATTSRARKLIHAYCISCTSAALWSDFSMRSKINVITSRLQDLCKQKTDLGLVEIPEGRSTASDQGPETTCLPIEPAVCGRDKDKAKILELVLTHEPDGANFRAIPIVGMGGIGKTTLAREVYNDVAVKDFNPKAWVWISDDFDASKISKSILECISSTSCGVELASFNVVQNLLRDALNGKKFLIVLDNVWSWKDNFWEILKAPFVAGAPGSKIIVTTRNIKIASTMRPRERYDLDLLSDDDCWTVFFKHAFDVGDIRTNWNLNIIREKVLQKCEGLPLAAKTLGGILYNQKTEEEWMNTLNSKIWDPDGNIHQVLRLSYYHLPSHLKRCFAYCSILPKDYEFEEKELVLLWMAEDLIQQSNDDRSNDCKQLEDLGGQYFRELLSRSIFQKSSSNTSKFVMHNLVNDLAQIVSKKISSRLEDELESNNQLRLFEKTRYTSYICRPYNGKKIFEVFNDAKHCLRTQLSVSPINDEKTIYYISNRVVSNLLSRLTRLRVLSLQYFFIFELPNSIGGQHLRYLNLSFTHIRSLPESINSMCNLQTLLLRNCRNLLKLPSNMGNLIYLRHLDILGASLIKEMPLGVKQWKCLQTLSDFIVGKDFGANLIDLEDLKSLRGELHISSLENVTNFLDTRKVILSDKKDLKVLVLEWGSRFDESQVEKAKSQDVKVLDMLQPHESLEKLTIRCYMGTKFSSWFGDGSFLESKITILELVDCKNCTSLPSLGLLGSLRILTIKVMKGIQSIGSEFYGEHCIKPFQSLETLCFENLEECKCWDHPVTENNSFPKLQELSIVDCPKLYERLPSNLSSLKKLEIRNCKHLVVSLSNISSLCELKLDECEKIVCTSSVCFESLESMALSNISDFGDWSMQEFQKVRSLKIEGCKKVIELWQRHGLHSFISLKDLVFKDCDIPFTTLFERIIQKNILVEEMSIERCNSLNFIFRGQIPQSLKKLCIENCEKLRSVLDDNEDTSASSSSFETLLPHLGNVNTKTCHLEHLSLSGCPSLKRVPSIHLLFAALTSLSISSCSNLTTIDQLPAALISLCISNCSNLTTLSLTGHLPMALKHLEISNCSELTTLLPKDHLPETLETLTIDGCEQLESIVDKFHNNNTLYKIYILNCKKLKSLPEDLHNLTGLRSIRIDNCEGFTSFPKGGFTSNNLTVWICKCSKVKALPSGIHNLSSLAIHDCPNMLLSEGLPTKLTELSIKGHRQYKVLMEKGFHNFTSLQSLNICGESDGEFIQEEDMTITLPSTLTTLKIEGIQKLKNLSFKQFQDLSSLKFLKIYNCPELISLPNLPSSLWELNISSCPLLKEACKRDRGREWSKIADIPCVQIDQKFIYDP